MDGLELYQIVTDFGVPGVLFLALLYQTRRVRELEKKIDETRATMASTHALLLNDFDENWTL